MTAEDVRAANRALDAEFISAMEALDEIRLHEPETKPDGEEAWSAATVLGHVAEFPHFFADELRRFLADPNQPVGRTHEHPGRLAALAASQAATLGNLRTAIGSAFADLDDALSGLTDAQLHATTRNRKYGDEPLTAFLDRYVIGHKRAHLRQLAQMPAAVREPR